MAIKRIIGVDFGTSTSVIRVKSYEEGKSQPQNLDTKEVVFGGMGAMVPTLIQKKNDNESVVYYGFEAEQKKKKTTTYHSFKVDLESSDSDKKALARKLTEEFFGFLAEKYKEQSKDGHLGESDEQEQTIVSYPVKWSEETRAFMIAAAKKAGFPNVSGMDEAQAAIHAVTVQSNDYLREKGLLVKGVPTNILLIDMGAGTTDLVLCRYTAGDKAEIEILNTWPKDGDILFGGKEVDSLLQDFFRKMMDPMDAEQAFGRIGIDSFKSWKEKTVSPALEKNDAVTEFFALDNYAELVGIEMDDYKLNRASFEQCAKNYLVQLPLLVTGCLKDANMNGGNVDLVIVTGGHSQWYFVKEMLKGKMKQFGEMGLTKIEKEPFRLIPISRPQETVALGLVYSPIPVKVTIPKKENVVSIGNKTDEMNMNYVKYRALCPVPTREKDAFSSVVSGKIKIDKHTLVPVVQEEKKKPIAPSAFREDHAELLNRVCMSSIRSVFLITPDNRLWKDGRELGMNLKSIVRSGVIDTVGLREDGTVVDINGKHNVGEWKNITSIACNESHIVGLKEDGTVVATGCHIQREYNVGEWRNITSIACSKWHTVGLKEDGTVVATGYNLDGKCNVGGWRNITSIACSEEHTVGLKEDGTVVATGNNFSGQCNVSQWKDIVAIKVDGRNTIGIQRDGRVIYTTYDLHKREKRNWYGKVIDTYYETEILPSKITSETVF